MRMSNVKIIGFSLLTISCLSLVLAVFMVTQICHLGAFHPSSFNISGQCSASDTPNEVFLSFVAIGAIVFTPLVFLIAFAARLARRPKR